MIIKIKFKQNKDTFTMLFGNSYKQWQEQYRDFVRMFTDIDGEVPEPVRYWQSKSDWKGFGGLKWCEAEHFQQELNREGVQHDEPDNPSPRQYSTMFFKELTEGEFNQKLNKD